MRRALFRKNGIWNKWAALVAALLFVSSAGLRAQGMNPKTQITWPSPSCTMAGYTYSPQSNTCVPSAGAGVTQINGQMGAFTFNGSGVTCTLTTCTFSGATGAAGGALAGTYPNPTLAGAGADGFLGVWSATAGVLTNRDANLFPLYGGTGLQGITEVDTLANINEGVGGYCVNVNSGDLAGCETEYESDLGAEHRIHIGYSSSTNTSFGPDLAYFYREGAGTMLFGIEAVGGSSEGTFRFDLGGSTFFQVGGHPSAVGTAVYFRSGTNGIQKLVGANNELTLAVADTDYQLPITLTTTGTSGPSTFTGDVLNIPNYAGGGGGYTPPTGTGFPHITSGAQDPAAVGETGTGDVARADSPIFTGNPAAPTAAQNNNSTILATTAYADRIATQIVNSNNTWLGINSFGSHVVSGSNFSVTGGSISNLTFFDSFGVTSLPTGMATSGGNFSSFGLSMNGSYWTGSAAASDQVSLVSSFAAGANPLVTLNFSHTGSPGGFLVNLPANSTINNSAICTVASPCFSPASPGAIGGTTPAAGTFTSVTAATITSTGSAPSGTFGAGAGTAPASLVITGNDTDTLISFTSGTAPVGSAVITTMTFHDSHPAAPKGVMCYAVNGSATIKVVWSDLRTATGYNFMDGAAALTASMAYVYSCHTFW